MASGLHQLAPLYAVGSLDESEKSGFEAHLPACRECQAEILAFQELIGEIGSLKAAAPPASLRDRVLEQVRGSSRVPGVLLKDSGVLILRSAEMPWTHMGPGIDCKTLFLDRVRHYATLLVRLQPGVSYPGHRHADSEEIFVLSGDFRVNGIVMGAGDYWRANAGSIHPEAHTESGCTMLLLSSQNNELFGADPLHH
jgi:anti-sigma factor ChrR (cupin superfamily)